MQTLLFVRHGETLANKEKRWLGQYESPLSEEGKRQARQLEKVLESYSIEAIYTSTSLRTLETIEGFAKKKGLVIKQEKAFCEIDFGEFEGRSFAELQNKSPEEVQKMLKEGDYYTYPGGESLVASYERNIKGLKALMALPQKTVLLCAHAGTLRNCISYLVGGSHKLHWHFKIDPASLTCFTLEGDFAVCEVLNHTYHYKNHVL
ncbi:histidine phosphatase family protein [Sporanaerobium hydrogeniformans]|uniref:Histidine phosphatase family protein n=1 Tax=Sporanaerobium hydrogeniformans TaxID=3072179 RepID=A0AC61DF66_9FIRM|nr:histidine phosphatase family protein [Sporanaerobium hydrogeniformans]PHV71844.1 histidine phosphatase family protein [Sporanaerobium hydrogeniformans]